VKSITVNTDVAALASAKFGEPVNKPRRRRYSYRQQDSAFVEPTGRKRREGEAIIAKVGGFLR
jgi:hypothetical protein